MEFSKTQKIISVALVVLVLGIFIYYIKNNNTNNIGNTQNDNATTTEVKVSGTDNSNFTIEQVPVVQKQTNTIKVPDLSRKSVVDPSLNYSDEVKASIIAKIESTQSSLKTDTNNLTKWIDLGIYQKMAGDYEGARQSWLYVSQKSSDDFVSLGNLGYLYAYYLKNNGMAEEYYRQAIKRAPTQTYLYIQLAEVFRDVFKDMDKAKQIIDEGLLKNKGDASLMEFKNNLK